MGAMKKTKGQRKAAAREHAAQVERDAWARDAQALRAAHAIEIVDLGEIEIEIENDARWAWREAKLRVDGRIESRIAICDGAADLWIDERGDDAVQLAARLGVSIEVLHVALQAVVEPFELGLLRYLELDDDAVPEP